jgi:dUTP pyrophosphatase
MFKIQFAKLTEGAIIPTKKHVGDVGFDIYSIEDTMILSNWCGVIKTGITCSFPDDLLLRILAKSRSNYIVGAGVIESNYQGELLVKLFNISQDILRIEKGVAIAQLVFFHKPEIESEEVDIKDIHMNTTSRGATGGIVSQIRSDGLEYFSSTMPISSKPGSVTV